MRSQQPLNDGPGPPRSGPGFERTLPLEASLATFELAGKSVAGLLANGERHVGGVCRHIDRYDAQVGNLERGDAVNAQVLVHDAAIVWRPHLACPDPVPVLCKALPDPLCEHHIVCGGAHNILDVWRQRPVPLLAHGVRVGVERGVYWGVLTTVDSQASDNLALLLVQPHGHGKIEAVLVGQDARYQVKLVFGSRACDMDVAAGVRVK